MHIGSTLPWIALSEKWYCTNYYEIFFIFLVIHSDWNHVLSKMFLRKVGTDSSVN